MEIDQKTDPVFNIYNNIIYDIFNIVFRQPTCPSKDRRMEKKIRSEPVFFFSNIE